MTVRQLQLPVEDRQFVLVKFDISTAGGPVKLEVQIKVSNRPTQRERSFPVALLMVLFTPSKPTQS